MADDVQNVTVAGESVPLSWSLGTQRAVRIRSSKSGLDPTELLRDFPKPRKAEFAVTAVLWMLLPERVYKRYETPEDLYADLPDDEAADRFAAVLSVVSSATVTPEKKSTSRTEPSPVRN